VGTGDGSLLDALAPIYERVVAVDRAEPQLARARERLHRRGYDNVELLGADADDTQVRARVDELGGADVAFASRVLHHAPRPIDAMERLAELVAPGGAVVVIDYVAHQDERMREQADLWLGFEPDELIRLARRVGLEQPHVTPIPAARCGEGPDGHLDWQVLVARRAGSPS
jgi:ArsR family transcriptional regulator